MAVVSTIFRGSKLKEKSGLIPVYHLFRGSRSQRRDCPNNPPANYSGNARAKPDLLEHSSLISAGLTPDEQNVTQCHSGCNSAFLFEFIFLFPNSNDYFCSAIHFPFPSFSNLIFLFFYASILSSGDLI